MNQAPAEMEAKLRLLATLTGMPGEASKLPVPRAPALLLPQQTILAFARSPQLWEVPTATSAQVVLSEEAAWVGARHARSGQELLPVATIWPSELEPQHSSEVPAALTAQKC